MADRSGVVEPESNIFWILADFDEFAETDSDFAVFIESAAPEVINIEGPSCLFEGIVEPIFAGKFLSLRVTDRVIFDEEGGGGGLFGFEDLDEFMFGGDSGGFFGFGFFFGLEVFSDVFGFAAELFVGVFGELFFDRRDASFFHVFVHVDVGGIGTLVIFELVLVATGLTSAVVLRTGDVSLVRGNVLVHGIIFYFCLSLIYYIALYIATQAFLHINLRVSDFIELFHH